MKVAQIILDILPALFSEGGKPCGEGGHKN